MKIKQVIFENFRGFEHLDIEFNLNQPTVFVGVNGVGKSSILDGIEILFSWFIARVLYDPEAKNSYIYKKNQYPSMTSEADLARGFTISREDLKVKNIKNKLKIKTLLNDQEVSWILDDFFDKNLVEIYSTELDKFTQTIREKQNSKEITYNVPLFSYYTVNRLVNNIPLERINHLLKPIDVYKNRLEFKRIITFDTFFQWYRSLEDIENEEIRDDPKYRDHQLEAVRQAIHSFIPDFTKLRVRRSPLRMTVNKKGTQVSINQLSDGEKGLIALVGDLARQFAIANPSLSNPLEGEGVVLIDEIELHLHPQWQRSIIGNLTRTFPNCQFIITTHSPQVISEVPWVHLLRETENGIVCDRVRTYGKDSNIILEALMGTTKRPKAIQEKLDQLFVLIDEEKIKEAKALKNKIAEEMGTEPSELVKAEWLIADLEMMQEENEVYS